MITLGITLLILGIGYGIADRLLTEQQLEKLIKIIE